MPVFFKSHPFAVDAYFDQSIVLAYAVPAVELERLLPPGLAVDTYDRETGFVAAAFVQTRKLRPKGFPAFLGMDFFLVGYRIFVNYRSSNGKRLRGLYILGSETDKLSMSLLGNLFTDYQYRRIDVALKHDGSRTVIDSNSAGIHVVVSESEEPVSLPPHTPFQDWKEARRFAGPLPFTFSFDKTNNSMLIVEGVREHWIPKPITVLNQQVDFFDKFGFSERLLANAFVVKNIPYMWKKGRRELWKS